MEDEIKQMIFGQDLMLQQLQVSKIPVGIYLKKGIKMHGVIIAFDSHVIISQSDDMSQMIYKHAIATIVPERKGR